MVHEKASKWTIQGGKYTNNVCEMEQKQPWHAELTGTNGGKLQGVYYWLC